MTDGPSGPVAHSAGEVQGERLAKRLAAQLGCSRREAELHIENGAVSVDGVVMQSPSVRVQPHQQLTLAPGARAQESPPVTLILHQGAGLDAQAALDLLRPEHHTSEQPGPPVRVLQRHFRQLHCVAALPAKASGLAVYTQDVRVQRYFAERAALLEHECLADVQGQIAPDGLERLRAGLLLPSQLQLAPIKASWQSEQRLRLAFKGVALQLLAPAFEDARLYRAGAAIEQLITERDGAPFWAQAPSLVGASAGKAAN